MNSKPYLEAIAYTVKPIINDGTKRNLERFLEALPSSNLKPKMAPGMDGGIVLIWEQPWVFTVEIDECSIHAVAIPGADQPVLFPKRSFDDPSIVEILQAIPKRSSR